MTIHKPATSERQPADLFEQRYGVFGERERRQFPAELRRVKSADEFTMVGHAAVFDQWSLDLGFFREKISRGAFDNALAKNPDVWHLWDHDTRYVLSRTRNKTLELSIDPRGLRYWSEVAATSYAEDLRVLLERGDIDQSSFAFTVASGGDEWVTVEEDGEEQIERTIHEIGDLFDVTTTAAGAYPQTDSQVAGPARSRLVAHMRSRDLSIPDWLADSVPVQSDRVPAAVAPSRTRSTSDQRLAALRAKSRRALLDI